MKSLAPNTLLQNRYLIVHLIGKGGMGEVYLAVDQRLGSAVALKRMFFSEDELIGAAFEREARILARLRHPVLPKVSDHFVENENQYLIMEHISGDDLAKRLESNNKSFPLNWVMFWADQLLDALNYLHSHEPPIIHRDLKPQNLKLTDENHIVLLDFGLSKNTVGQTHFSTHGGVSGYTPNYAPMEQIRGTGTNARSDIYALSATLYQLLTNVIPADSLTRADSLLNGSEDPIKPIYEINKEVPKIISDIIIKGMSVSQEQRFPAAREMQKAMRDAYAQIQNQMAAQTLVLNAEESKKIREESSADAGNNQYATLLTSPPPPDSIDRPVAQSLTNEVNGSNGAETVIEKSEIENSESLANIQNVQAPVDYEAEKISDDSILSAPIIEESAKPSVEEHSFATDETAPLFNPDTVQNRQSDTETEVFEQADETEILTVPAARFEEDYFEKNNFESSQSEYEPVGMPEESEAEEPETEKAYAHSENVYAAAAALPPSAAAAPAKKSGGRSFLAIGGLLGLLIFATAAIGSWFIYRNYSANRQTAPVTVPTIEATPMPTLQATPEAMLEPTPADNLAVEGLNSNTSTLDNSEANATAGAGTNTNQSAQTTAKNPPVINQPARQPARPENEPPPVVISKPVPQVASTKPKKPAPKKSPTPKKAPEILQ